jgi:hypothetical protein
MGTSLCIVPTAADPRRYQSGQLGKVLAKKPALLMMMLVSAIKALQEASTQ